MRNTLLFACLAALCLAACDAAPPRPPQASLPEPTPRLAQGPGESPTLADVLPVRTEELPETIEDLHPAEPVDTLALAHEEHLQPVDHLARARVLHEEGDLSGALTEARRAVHDAADDREALDPALDTVIRLARRSGHKQLAADAYGELARLYPDGSEPLVQHARLLLELGDLPGAFHAAETALELDPEYPEVYQVLGRAHLAAGELDEAITRFKQAVHLDPYHGYALNNLGLACLRTGLDAQAAEALAQAAYLLPHVAFVHNNLGLAYERLGRLEEARMAYDTATRLAPHDAKARLNRDRLNREVHASVDLRELLGERSSPGCPE
jgi:Flp pilus assembly protein TadD